MVLGREVFLNLPIIGVSILLYKLSDLNGIREQPGIFPPRHGRDNAAGISLQCGDRHADRERGRDVPACARLPGNIVEVMT